MTAAPTNPQTQTSTIAGLYRIVSWTTADGLPQNSINDMALLANGELWLSTFGGLARFDGQTFRIVDVASDRGLPNNRVLSLQPTGPDTFFFLTLHGQVGRLERGRATTLAGRVPDPLDVLALHRDEVGRLYARTADGGLWSALEGQPWTRLMAGRRVTGSLRGFATTEDGALWTAMGERFVRIVHGAPHASVDVPLDDYNLFRRVGGGLWVGTTQGLVTFSGKGLEPVDVKPALTKQVTAVAQRAPDVVWVATKGELLRLARQSGGWWRSEPLPLPLPRDHFIRSLLIDDRGSVWVGTTGLGLFRLDRLPVTRFGAGGELGAITGLAADGVGGAFLVDYCRGLVHASATGRLEPVPLEDAPQARAAYNTKCSMALAARTPGSVWLRIEDRLFVAERQPLDVRPVATRVTFPKEEGGIAADGAGGLFVVSRAGTVQHVSATGDEIGRWTLQPPLVNVTVAPDGTPWIGSEGRVYHLLPDGVATYGAAEGVPQAEVRDILVQRDGTAWFGTYGGGIGRFVQGHVAVLTVAHGLPDNGVSRMLTDGKGRFWIATNRGIAVLPISELEEAASGRRSVVAPVVFGPERGVDEATFGRPAGFGDANGRLWFGTIAGALAIDAARFPFSTQPPRARVEAIAVDGVPLARDSTRVPAGASRLRIEFSASPVSWPERTRFRFRFEDDADWLDTGAQRTLDLTAPAPGRHRLLVQARNEDGVWSVTPAALDLDVEPAWWQTTAARSAAAVAAALVVFGGYRQRVRSIERRHGERMRALLEQRQQEARVADLRAQLDHVSRVALAGELAASLAHEVSQPLAAMVNNAEAGRRRLDHYVARPQELQALFDDLLADGMRASTVMKGLRAFLRPRATEVGQVDLSAVVLEMLPLVDRELRQCRVALDLALAEDLPTVDGVRVQIGQIVVNLVRNAWEAMATTTGERRLRVATRAVGGRVELRVRDHGPGPAEDVVARMFDPFVTTKAEGLGMGLAICRAIAEAHGGHLAAARADPGLEVVLSLPASRSVKEA